MSEQRCAQCGAAMAADAPWCTLCLTPRSAPEPAVPTAVAVAATNASLYAPPVLERPADEVRTWPCHRCGAAVPLDLDVCPACGAAFLGGAGDQPTLSLPLVGDMSGRSKGATYGIAAGIGFGFALLLVSVVAVIGLIF